MAKQRTLLTFLVLCIIAGNVFCLNSNDWAIHPSSSTTIEPSNVDCDGQVVDLDDDDPSSPFDFSTNSNSYKRLLNNSGIMPDDKDCVDATPFFVCNTTYLNNSGFESNLTDWSGSGIATTTSNAYSGSVAVKLDNTAGGGGFWQDGSATITPGEIYTVSCYAKKTGDCKPTIGIKFSDASWTEIESSYITVKSTSYEQVSVSLMAPSNAVHMTTINWLGTNGIGTGYYDDFCIEKETVTPVSCSNSTPLLPNHSNYLFAIDTSGTGAHWMEYDQGDLTMCNNGDGTLSITGHVIGGRDAVWGDGTAIPCGTNDMWYIDITLSDNQTWDDFKGSIVQNAGCESNKVDWDFWNASGTYTGLGCNAGQTVVLNPVANGSYRLQIGQGGNSNNCDYGISAWIGGTLNGHGFKSDIYAKIEETSYTSLRPPRQPACPETVSNKQFDNGDTDWNLSVNTSQNAAATYSIDNSSKLSGTNSAYINITNSSGIAWHVQLFQDGKTLDATKTYILSFDAKAVANRSIDVALQERGPTDWGSHWYQSVALTTSKQSFSYEFTPNGNSAANAGIMFHVGGTADNVYIDNVSFKEKCVAPPTTTTACTTTLVTNNDFENDLTDWQNEGDVTITSDAYSGSKAVVINNTAAAAGLWQSQSATAGEVFTVSGYYKKSGTGVSTISIQFYDNNNNQLFVTYKPIEANNYEFLSVSGMAPANTSSVRIVGWSSYSNGGITHTYYDAICMEKYNLPATTCGGASCIASSASYNYVFALDDSGAGHNFLAYDKGDLILCDNGDSTLTLKGQLIGAENPDWNTNGGFGTPCGYNDGWTLEMTLSDMQSWVEFQGDYVQKVGCNDNYVDWDYWQVSGTLIGTGCNQGRTITIDNSTGSYRLQAGLGGNSNSCNYGMSTWFDCTENGQVVKADLYIDLDKDCYTPMRRPRLPRPTCPLTNMYPGFAIDFISSPNTQTWTDYDLGSNMQMTDNQDGTMTIYGVIDNAVDADWDGGTATPCGSDDEWYVTLNLSDRKTWTEWQAMGGTSNVHNNCSVDGLDYWAVSGTLSGMGCNAGKTLAISAGKDNYRLQIGPGGNNGDSNCDFGMSTWFDILDENGQEIQADIYAFLDESCYNSGATPPPTSSCPNTVTNSEFDDGPTDWAFFTDGANPGENVASLTVDNSSQLSGTNAAYVDISATSGAGWHIQMYQEYKTLDATKTYIFSFDAKAEADRTIYASLQSADDWSDYWGETVSLTTSNQSFSYELTPSGSNNGNVRARFSLGQSDINFYIDNISFKEKCATTPPNETCTIATDDLNTNNISGGTGWIGNWSLTNSSIASSSPGGFTSGALLYMDGSSYGKAERTLDLSNYSTAELSFDFECNDSSSGFENTDFVNVQVSTDGGTTFTTLWTRDGDQICPEANDSQSDPITVTMVGGNASTIIRFESGTNSGSEDIYWDNIEIKGSCGTATPPPPSEVCDNGIDDDGDGLIDCDDADCSLLSNSGLENSNITFNYSHSICGSPASKIAKNSTELSNWTAGLAGDCMYHIDDTNDNVNNPEGDYFVWLPGIWDCLISTQQFPSLGMVNGNQYTISFNVAVWEVSLNGSCEPDGGSVTQADGKVRIEMEDFASPPTSTTIANFDLIKSTSCTNLNWQKISHTFTYDAANHKQFGVTNASSNGIFLDNVNITAGSECSVAETCGGIVSTTCLNNTTGTISDDAYSTNIDLSNDTNNWSYSASDNQGNSWTNGASGGPIPHNYDQGYSYPVTITFIGGQDACTQTITINDAPACSAGCNNLAFTEVSTTCSNDAMITTVNITGSNNTCWEFVRKTDGADIILVSGQGDGNFTLPDVSIADVEATSTPTNYTLWIHGIDCADATVIFTDCVQDLVISVPDCSGTSLNSEVCYIIGDGKGDGYLVPDTLFSVNPITGVTTVIGPTGTMNSEALAIDKSNGIIYTATEDTFGTINVVTGVFTSIANDIGNVNGSVGVLNINDVDGMSFDVGNNIIWASARTGGMDGLPDDVLFKIDPTTGLALPNAFGTGVGYLVVSTPEHDLDDVALATDGTLYAISNLGGSGNQRLGTINTTTGAWTEIGDYGVKDVESLSFTATGQLMATTGEDGSHKNRLYSIDAASATATFISNLGIAHDVEGCVCENANFINLQIGDKVWADLDNDGIQDIEEPGIEHVEVRLLDGSGNPILDDTNNQRITTTDFKGEYNFDRLNQGSYQIEFVLPTGTSFASKDSGSDEALDSDADVATGLSPVITLTKSNNNMDIDAGLLNANVTERTCANAGELFVGDANSGSIIRIDQNTGAIIDTFIQGLADPVHMVVGPDRWLYVVDNDLNEIRSYSLTTGVLINTIAYSEFYNPMGLTFGTDGNIYLNNNWGDNILKVDPITEVVTTFVSKGSSGLDGSKSGIEFGPDGHLYVVSSITNEVFRYNGTTGAFIDIFVTNVSGELNGPWDLIFGSDGHLYVTSNFNDKVVRFNGTTGTYIDKFVTYQSGGIDHPTDLVFGADGHLYVSAGGTSTEVYRYDGTTGAFIDVFTTGLIDPKGMLFAPVPDCEEACTEITAIAQNNTGVANPDNALGLPDGNYADLRASDTLIVDFGEIIAEGEVIQIDISRGNDNGRVKIKGSTSPTSGFSGEIIWGNPANSTHSATEAITVFETIDYTIPSGGARYIRFRRTNGQVRVDGISYCKEVPTCGGIVTTTCLDNTTGTINDDSYSTTIDLSGNSNNWSYSASDNQGNSWTNGASGGPIPHNYDQNDSYPITITLTGGQDACTQTITINNAPACSAGCENLAFTEVSTTCVNDAMITTINITGSNNTCWEFVRKTDGPDIILTSGQGDGNFTLPNVSIADVEATSTPSNYTLWIHGIDCSDASIIFTDCVQDLVISVPTDCGDSTPPPPNCPNLLADGEFDDGINDWGLYVDPSNNAVANFSIDNSSKLSGTNSAFIDITNPGTDNWELQFNQTGHSIETGKEYTVSFQAMALVTRPVHIAVQKSSDDYRAFGSEDITVTTTPQTYTFTFTAQETITGDVSFVFHIGGDAGSLYFDNIHFAETCDTNTAPPANCANKLTDENFDNGTNDWGFSASSSNNAVATFNIDNNSKLSGTNSAFIDITNPGTNAWDIQLIQDGLSIEIGKEYTVSFEAMAPNTRPIQFAVQKASADYRGFGSGEVTITPQPQTYSYNFIAQETNTGDVAFIFHVGGEAGSVYIDNIHFAESCGTEICDNNIDDDHDGLIDGADPDCSSTSTCSSTGANLFQNPGFEDGNWTGSETFVPGVYATPTYELSDWGAGNSKWVETTKATEGNRVLYINSDDPNEAVCINQRYPLGSSQIINTCDTYQVCFDWASFNSDHPDGRTTRSQPALDIGFFDAAGDAIDYANLPIGKAVANQDWDNLTWTSESLTFQLKGSFTPPSNTTEIVVFLSEFKGMANGLIFDNVKLSVTSQCDPITEICDNNNVDDDGDGDADCDDTDCQSIVLSSPIVSSCIDQPLRDVATVSVEVTWSNGPAGDDIEVSLGDKTETIFVASGTTSPHTVEFITIADGSTNHMISAIWKNNTTYCTPSTTFDSPAACSNDQLSCNILYLCGAEKPYDGDPWDHGFMTYVDQMNGIAPVAGLLTKADGSGMGTYDISNPTTFVNINLSDYDLIIVSATTEGHIAGDLVDSLKNFEGSILNSNYLLIDDLGLSASAGAFTHRTDAYIDNTTEVDIYNYDNIDPSYDYVFTHGEYTTAADGFLWMYPNNQSSRRNSLIFHYEASDALPGLSGGHGTRVYLGYHMNGIYANPVNGGALPAPVSTYFSPEKHLTLKGKELFDQALVLAGSGCDLIEICGNNLDDDGDGEIDCNDGDCGQPVITSVTPTNANNCPDLNNGTITIVATGANLEYSIDNGNTYQDNNQFINLVKGSYNIRVQNSATGCLETAITTLSNSSCDEDCTDGVDNNGDEKIDCDDNACGRPAIIEVTPENPDNCPILDNGQITIIAAGANLSYSIDNGINFQSARIFTNLANGTYNIVVKNGTTTCEVVHTSTITLTDPTCIEICDNGIDDDGNNLIDCADGACGQPAISDVSFTDPANCPNVNDGTITITATGTNLEYSIDNGTTYQGNPIFSDLYAGNYVVTVRNTISGCQETYTQNLIELAEPVCEEICDNGIDDDGNGLIDYQERQCRPRFPRLFIPTSKWLCEGSSYTFEVELATPNFTYAWDFGTYASQATATGIGPHTITFDPPTGTEAISPVVYFTATAPTYEVRDTYHLQIRPEIVITKIEANNPSDCGEDDGAINLSIQRQADACIEVSFDGGNSWIQENQIRFDHLRSGNFNIVARYCEEPCGTNSNIVTLTNPSTSTVLGNDDFTDLCPGQIYSNTVISNDIVQNRYAQYSLASPTEKGEVTMKSDGSFEYIVADSTFCGVDQFSYKVCNLSNTCCATAFVTLYLTDTTDPILENVPADITIGCDEEVPLPPFITAYDNCPAISIDKEEVSTQGLNGCSLHSYTITRAWIATDVCGNSTRDEQVISVEDAIAPDIFRIYTLPNGKKMVAGVMENVSESWKTVSFPIQFLQTPLVFTQVVSNKDTTSVMARIRNVSANQFELKIQQEEAATDAHFRETVSWIAMEAGTQTEDYLLDAKTIEVTDAVTTINFANTFNNTPACFTSMQTIKETDAAAPRLSGLGTNNVQVNIQEELSKDTEIAHASEAMAYLALEQVGDIKNSVGDIIGEVGTIDIDQEWTRIITNNTYYNPVIITQVATQNDATPVLSRVHMERSGSFDLRLQKWDDLNPTHAVETVYYMIIEGSIPLNANKYCLYGTDSLELGVDMVAVDNCDPSVKIQYAESQALAGANNHTIRTWFAEDACGNNTVYSQVINCQGISLKLKAYLQGALVNNGTTGLMRDDLRTAGLIPTTEPYSDLEGFTHVGTGGGETVSDSLLAQTGNDAIVDWVFIEIKDGENFDKVVVTSSALIQRDGDVVTAEGAPIISYYNLAHGNYYVKLRHRNHLGAETAYPYIFTANNIPYVDFSDGFTPVRGNTPRVEINDKLASWSGDLNGDDLTVFQGPNNDIFYMFLQILLDEQNEDRLSNFISAGYTTRDFNMDGTVIFQGPNNDRSILLWNTVYNHPDNEQNQSNFVVTTAEIVTQANYDDCVRDNKQSFCDFDNDGTLNGSDPDDDNDGVADGNDKDPYDINSDSDGDSISDIVETRKDQPAESGPVTDPLSPCDPHQDNGVCEGIDMDGDSLYFNYPVNHAKYDPNDQNACEPNGNAAQCSCPDEDGDGYIFVCSDNASTGRSTIRIPVEDWLAQQAAGTVCGPCQDAIDTSCDDGVNLLGSTHTKVKGANKKPRLLNFNIPKGENRTLVIIADFEREHCDEAKYCDPSQNPNGEYLGDNFAFNNTNNGTPFITAKLSSPAGVIYLQNSVNNAFTRNVLKFHSMDGSPEKAYHSRELYLLTLEEAFIDALLGNVNSGAINIRLPGVSSSKDESDEAILFAYVFENVAQEENAINLFKGNLGSDNVMGDFTLPLNDLGNGTPTDQAEDGLLVIGMNSMGDAGFNTLEGFTELDAVSIQNPGGGFTENNEGDGMSTSVQFRNGLVLAPLQLQSTGAAASASHGGTGLVFSIHSCYDNSLNTPALIDNDGDGFYANANPYDAQDDNACYPEVGAVCIGEDNDGDGVYGNYPPADGLYDEDDMNPCAPFEYVFACAPIDQDNDGYYGNADPNDLNFDIDDFNSCVPEVGTSCSGIDGDNDGTYGNYPDTHPDYDANDMDKCVPHPNGFACNPIDQDADGYFSNTDSGDPYYDTDDFNPCIPVVSGNCYGIDNDSDTYYENYPPSHGEYDPDDTYECVPNPSICNADDDGDGIEAINDPNDNDPCDPIPGNPNCSAIDNDFDGYYTNYPTSHHLFDPNDNDDCVPNSTVCGSCTTFYGWAQVCINAGTPNEQEQLTTDPDFYTNGNQNAYCGPCADYSTISDGSWDDMHIWKDGNIPPYHLYGQTVVIRHHVTAHQEIKLHDEANLYVRKGNLHVKNNSIHVYGGVFSALEADVTIDQSLIIDQEESIVFLRDGFLSIGQGYNNNGGSEVYYEDMCIEVANGDYISNYNLEAFDNSYLTVANGNLEYTGNTGLFTTKFFVASTSRFDISGNLINQGKVTFVPGSKDIIALKVGGNVVNSGTWNCYIEQAYCIGGSNEIPSDELRVAEDCSTIGDYFPGCNVIGDSEICGNGLDDDGNGLIDCEDGACENIFTNGSFNFIAYTQDPNGSWLAENSDITALEGQAICLGWQPSPAPTNTTTKWLNENGSIISTNHDLCFTNLSMEDAGNYTLELISDAGCEFIKSYTVTVTPNDNTCIDDDNDGMITVCKRNNETETGTTQEVPVADWPSTKQPFDYCGPCATYISIKHGDWGSPSTWKNNNRPPYSSSGEKIRITHNVTVSSAVNIVVDGWGHLTIENGALNLLSDQSDLKVVKGTVNSMNSHITVGDDLKLTNVNAKMIATGGTLEVKKRIAHNSGNILLTGATLIVADGLDLTRNTFPDFDKAIHINNAAAIFTANESTLKIHHSVQITAGTFDLNESCAFVDMHWLNENGVVTINNSDLEVAGDLTNNTASTTTFNNANIYLSDDNPFNYGNLINYGEIFGQINTLYISNGYVDAQYWEANVTTACIKESSSNDIPANRIGSNDCTNIVGNFGTNVCFEIQDPNNGAMVNLLNEHTVKASGSGAGGVPSLTGFNIPAGQNRQMIVMAFFERNHCVNDCPSPGNYNGLGDQYANGLTTGQEQNFNLKFRLKNGSNTKYKYNMTGDNFGNHHSARNMVFYPENPNTWQEELGDYHKAVYSTEAYFITYNESEISSLLNGAASGDISVDFPNIHLPAYAADDAILTAVVFENVGQQPNDAALSGKFNGGKEFRSPTHVYEIDDLIDGVEPNEPTDGFFVIGASPIEGDFKTMPGFNVMARLSDPFTNSATGSTLRGEHNAISTSGQFRRGPSTGIINSVSMQGDGVGNTDPVGSVIFAFTLESYD